MIDRFEYVALEQLFVESDQNVEEFAEYLMDILSLDEFSMMFRNLLENLSAQKQ